MFQDYALFPHRSVAENVAFGLRMQRLPGPEIANRVHEALARVNLSDFADRRVTDLSGGEQQRVALARALAPRPRLLMLDEPLGALDRALREQLGEFLREVLHQTGIPAIYVTHDRDGSLCHCRPADSAARRPHRAKWCTCRSVPIPGQRLGSGIFWINQYPSRNGGRPAASSHSNSAGCIRP